MKFEEKTNVIDELISNSIDKISSVVKSQTIVGEAITNADGTQIIPISKVSVGFVVGGGEYADLSARRVANHFPMSGGSSGGMSVSPVGFLIVKTDGVVEFVNVENKSLYQTILNTFNSIISKLEKSSGEKN